MKELRLLKPNEIDVRVGSINEKGATLLLYKDARVDMNILDETVGVGGWQRKHYELKGHIYASVGVKIDDEWVWKDDVGTESVSEATKGESSDSFKRACFNWGIGRELYTAPFTWISADNYTSFKNPKTGKLGTYDKFVVVSIMYDESREISYLVIKNDKTGKTVFDNRKTIKVEANKEIRNRAEEANEAREAIDVNSVEGKLIGAKKDINEDLIKQNYVSIDDRRAFIKFSIGKETIETIEEARAVAESLEEQQ